MSADSERSLAVVCLSGGLDSCVAVAHSLRTHGEIAALHLDYGQRTESRERRAFEDICDHYGIVRRLRARQPILAEIGASALTDTSLEIPTAASTVAAPLDGIPITYVPFRNGQILALACAWAEALGARSVVLGAVEEDSSGYPDCRERFFEAFQRAVDAGTRPGSGIRLSTPLLHEDKAGIVRLGIELDAPLHLSWSCYSDEDVACGECESCTLRLKGFAAAGREDPIPYASRKGGKSA